MQLNKVHLLLVILISVALGAGIGILYNQKSSNPIAISAMKSDASMAGPGYACNRAMTRAQTAVDAYVLGLGSLQAAEAAIQNARQVCDL